MKQFDENILPHIQNIYNFLEAYIDYHIGDPDSFVDCFGDTVPTDAQMLQESLPFLKTILDSPDVEMQSINSDDEFDFGLIERKAMECVNPNYKYCVVSSEFKKCGLTDDIGDAMEEASFLSKGNNEIFYVLSITKSKDESYKTYIEFFYTNGNYFEENMKRDFVHYNYIAQAVGEVYKIKHRV